MLAPSVVAEYLLSPALLTWWFRLSMLASDMNNLSENKVIKNKIVTRGYQWRSGAWRKDRYLFVGLVRVALSILMV